MKDALIELTNVRRSYDGRTVLSVDHLDAGRGEIVAVLGPNGSGKSTLFRIMLQLERPDAGEVRVRDGVVTAGVFQQPYLFSGTVRSNLGYGLSAHRVARADHDKRVGEMAELFDIGAIMGADVRTLSGGEQQRVALARALAIRPDLLVLDEPTASLDVTMKRTFRDDLTRARTQAGGVILITHDPAEAFGLADRIAVLDGGRLVQEGAPEDVLDAPQTRFVASFTGAELLLDGVVTGVADELVQVDSGGALIWAVSTPGWRPETGMRAHVAYRAEDVLIAANESTLETSARNQYRVRITSLSGTGALIRLRLEGELQLMAVLTRSSVEALSLRPGVEVIAQMKATALHVLRAT